MKKITHTGEITDLFWTRYFDIVKDVMLPFQWDIIHDKAQITIESERDDANIPTAKSHVIENFKIAAGHKKGNHYGWLFQDSDLYKWIEAAANTYCIKPDAQLLEMMQACVTLVEEAQDADGYVSTYYQINAPKLKFRRLFESHELYCAGHLIEAAIAYTQATGSQQLLEVADRFIDCIQQSFGPEPGKINGADGHQEIELALVRLYEFTGQEKYVELSNYFLKVRGQDPAFYQKQLQENEVQGLEQGPTPLINLVYHQAHKPVDEQTEAQGHAVRLVYMAQAMVGTARYLKDEKMLGAAQKIWDNIVQKRMYITGGIGSTVRGEAFTFDYDLPNGLMYCETCAAIGLLNFTHELQRVENKVEYADIMERILYNNMISGMSLDGKHFFYVNPLEADPEASLKNPDKSHVKATRPSWFGCACCPPNLARTIPAIYQYIYQSDETAQQLWINQWIGSEWVDERVQLTQTHAHGENSQSNFILHNLQKENYTVSIRIPYWLSNLRMTINGQEQEMVTENGYLKVSAAPGETEIIFEYLLPILKWQANPNVKSTFGKVAFQHGPYIYAAEEADNGKDLHLISITGTAERLPYVDEALGAITMIEVGAEKRIKTEEEPLYRLYHEGECEQKVLKLIPYYSWANRQTGEMRVWFTQGGH